MSRASERRGPAVRFPPPLLFISALVLAWLLDSRVVSLPMVESAASARVLDVSGGVLIIAGGILAAWGAITFWRHKTTVLPHLPASRLVEAGPYRFTRNPMYAGFISAYLGAMLLMNSLWPVPLLPLVLGILYRFVIRREEQHLTEAFGEEYVAYTQRVRRWL